LASILDILAKAKVLKLKKILLISIINGLDYYAVTVFYFTYKRGDSNNVAIWCAHKYQNTRD